MKTVPLNAKVRDGIGKQGVKEIRRQKRIPAVVYGHGTPATPIEVTQEDFFKVIHTKAGENVVIQLTISGEKNLEKTVVIKEIQHNPVTDSIVHVDFNAISLTEKIKVNVPVHVIGEAPGVKEGGILDVVHHEIEVECLPTNIPDRIDAEVSGMKISDTLHIRDLKFPAGVVPQLEEDAVIVALHAPKAEEEPVAEEGQPSEPEVITKKKEEEPGEEGAPAPAAEKKAPEKK